MVKDVFLKNKKLEESITFAEFVVNNQEYYDDFYEEDYSYPQLLIEGKSKKKISNKKICRIKNNKGEFIDIRKIKKDDKDDSHLLELPPPDGDENLITIGNKMSNPESLRLLEKVKRGKKKFRDFMNQKPTFIRKKTEEILF